MMQDAMNLTLLHGGRWFGRYGTLACPVCQPEAQPGQNALTLADGDKGLLVHCKKTGCDFRELSIALGIRTGAFAAPDLTAVARRDADRQAEAEKRAQHAHGIWDAAEPICGTIAETYLRKRGITCALPETLRFHPACWHGPTAQRLPAMVARVYGGAAFAVHRTYLRADGTGKADVPKGTEKMMLGACAGGAVQLACAPERLVVAEGIETTLSLSCGMLDGPGALWAALSTSGLRGLVLPARPARLTVARDGDAAGGAAALALAERAAALGWRVGMMDPGDDCDFNDILTRKVAIR